MSATRIIATNGQYVKPFKTAIIKKCVDISLFMCYVYYDRHSTTVVLSSIVVRQSWEIEKEDDYDQYQQ